MIVAAQGAHAFEPVEAAQPEADAGRAVEAAQPEADAGRAVEAAQPEAVNRSVAVHQPVAVRLDRSGATLAADVRTAGSLWARFMGLMGRRGLAPGEGLWLPTDASIHMLFMRFPIDAVFLAPAGGGSPVPGTSGDRSAARPPDATDDAWRVVAVRERLRQWTGVVWFVRGARGCLELEAGATARVGLRAGDILRFETRPEGTGAPGASVEA